jgi:outer membrane protein assembly factor BamB
MLTRMPQRFSHACCLSAFGLVCQLALISNVLLADWPVGRGNSAGTGATVETLPESLDLLWEVKVEGLGFDAGPIIAAGKVFAADADGRVIALELATGKELWRLELETGFMASPAYRDGTLFVGDLDGTLLALDANSGEEKWKFAGEMEVDGSPNFYQDSVLFTSRGGSLYAVNIATGELQWEYKTGDQLQCGATLVGKRTFLGGCDGYLHVVDVESGQAVGKPLPINGPTGSTPSATEDTVYVPTYAGEIFAFKQPDNAEMWKFKDEKLSSEFKNSVAIAQGLIVATSRNRQLFAVDAKSGEIKWQQVLRKRSDASPIIAGDQVVVAAADGRVLRFDLETGREEWMFVVKGSFLGSPAVADGKLVVASDRGTIYCFGAKP